MGTFKILTWRRTSFPVGMCVDLLGTRQPIIQASRIRCLSVQSLPKKSLVFLGTPSVAADVLDALLHAERSPNSLFEVAAVVTQPPSARGRGREQLPSPVEQRALQRNFPATCIFSPLKAGEESFLAELQKLKPDLCVTAAYGNILPNKFLVIPACGFVRRHQFECNSIHTYNWKSFNRTVNVHPSLLPLYRGAAPVQRALQDGVTISGVTLAYTVRALDAGPIIASESMELDLDIKAPELLRTLFQKGSQLLLRELPSILDRTARDKAKEQDHAKATSAPKVTSEESWLTFEQSAEVLHNKVRAFAEWPGTRATFQLCSGRGEVQPLELKIVTTRVGAPSSNGGHEISLVKDALVVPCGGDSTLEILQLQPPAKKVMSARDFCNGLRGHILKDVNGTSVASAHKNA